MVTEQALLAAIATDPADQTTRLALADWLEEAGRAAQAELARLHARQLMKAGTPEELARLCALLQQGVRPVVPEVVNSIGMRFVQIPPGELSLGASEGDAQQAGVIKPPFWLGMFPVTVGQFRAFMEDTDHTIEADINHLSWSNPWIPQTEEHPVTCVGGHDAFAFVTWLS